MLLTEMAYPLFDGYSEYLDEKGNKLYCDLDTGVIDDARIVEVPLGSVVFTAKQREAHRQYGERKEQQHRAELEKVVRDYELEKFNRRGTGDTRYYFGATKLEGDFAPATLVRSYVLASYLAYNDSHLRAERKYVRPGDLGDILNLTKATRDRFWAEVKGKLFDVDDTGIYCCCDSFWRGKLKSNPQNEYQHVFIQTLRELYAKTPTTRHKHLGYVFALLEHLSFEFNALCWNPENTDPDAIDFMTVGEFCDLVGYDHNQAARLWKDLNEIRFDVGGHQEYFVKLFCNTKLADGHIFVNPRVIYKGHYPRDLRAIATSFACAARQK